MNEFGCELCRRLPGSCVTGGEEAGRLPGSSVTGGEEAGRLPGPSVTGGKEAGSSSQKAGRVVFLLVNSITFVGVTFSKYML